MLLRHIRADQQSRDGAEGEPQDEDGNLRQAITDGKICIVRDGLWLALTMLFGGLT